MPPVVGACFALVLAAILVSTIPALSSRSSKRTLLKHSQRMTSTRIALSLMVSYVIKGALLVAARVHKNDCITEEENGVMGTTVYLLIWLVFMMIMCVRNLLPAREVKRRDLERPPLLTPTTVAAIGDGDIHDELSGSMSGRSRGDITLTQARRRLNFSLHHWFCKGLLFACFVHVKRSSLQAQNDKQTIELQAAVEQGWKISSFLNQCLEMSSRMLVSIFFAFGYLTYPFDAYVGLIMAGYRRLPFRAVCLVTKIVSSLERHKSKIGERSVKLCWDGRWRVVIVQFFLRDPNVVLLDEATSPIDKLDESDIQDSFAKIYKGSTTLIVAHDMPIAQNADWILVLENGLILECGSLLELLELAGRYFTLPKKKQTAGKRGQGLQHFASFTKQPLIDFSNVDTDGYESDDSSIADIMQVDGASESQQADESSPTHTGMRKRLHDLKRKLAGIKNSYEKENDDVDEDDRDDSPMRVVSPRSTDSAPPESLPRSNPFRRHSQSSLNTRSISAPLFSARIETEEEARARMESTHTGSMSISFPMLQKQEISNFEQKALSTPSPGKKEALGSHPPVHRGGIVDKSSAYRTPHFLFGGGVDVGRNQDQQE